MSSRPEIGKREHGACLNLAGREVFYSLRRSARRTIGLTIDHRGLRVGAPVGATLGSIESLIRQHQAWVLEKLDQWQTRATPESLGDGAEFPFLGELVRLRLSDSARRSQWRESEGELVVALPPGGSLEMVLARLLSTRARPLFQDRLARYAARLAVPVPPLFLSSARTRWGSCNSRGEVRLNWRLIHLPLDLIDYVVAHELAHLKEMNHSPRFWAVVEGLYPGWREARRELKKRSPGLPRL